MPSYLITGVSRGIGVSSTSVQHKNISTYSCGQFTFLEHISSDPSNTVIGLVRNVAETKAKVAPLNRSNVHILEGDLKNYDALKVRDPSSSSIAY